MVIDRVYQSSLSHENIKMGTLFQTPAKDFVLQLEKNYSTALESE